MDTEKHIEVLRQELDFCYDLLEKVNWETRLKIDVIILMLRKQLQKECGLDALPKKE